MLNHPSEMAAPTSPAGPSPVEVLSAVPRLSLSEASGAIADDEVIADAQAPTGWTNNGRRSSQGAHSRSGAGGVAGLFGLGSAFTAPANETTQVHPLDAFESLGGSDPFLPSIQLHIPSQYIASGIPASSLPPAPCAIGSSCVPPELQDGLLELSKFAIKKNITFSTSETDVIGQDGSESIPIGIVASGGQVNDERGGKWFWNLL